jgi:hypothetical protein
MLGVVVGGLGLLVALATFIGVAVDREARDAAWKRIAMARRRNAEWAEDLEQREAALNVREAEFTARERVLDRWEAQLERREQRLRDEPPDLPA